MKGIASDDLFQVLNVNTSYDTWYCETFLGNQNYLSMDNKV